MARASDLERERRREERERRELAKLLRRGRRGKVGRRLASQAVTGKGKGKRKRKVGDDEVGEKVVSIAGYTLKVPSKAKTGFNMKVKFDNSKVRVGQRDVVGSRLGFAKVKIYKKSDLLHMLHMLRIETERELSGKIELMGLNGESEDQIRGRLLRMHEVERQRGRKAQGNAYLEVVASFEDKRLVKRFMRDLSERFNTDVFGVIHYDENRPHVHIIVSWKDKRGKAIRLRRGDFRSVWRQAIETLQPSREVPSRKGLGRPSMPFWILRQAYLNSRWDEIIERLRLETYLYQLALRETKEEEEEQEKRPFSLKKAFYQFIKNVNVSKYLGWVGERKFREDFISFLKDNSYLKKSEHDLWYEVSREIEDLLGRPLFTEPSRLTERKEEVEQEKKVLQEMRTFLGTFNEERKIEVEEKEKREVEERKEEVVEERKEEERERKEEIKVEQEKTKEKVKIEQEKGKEEMKIEQEKEGEETKVIEEKGKEEAKVVEEKAKEEVKVVEEKGKEKAKVIEEKAREEVKVIEEKAREVKPFKIETQPQEDLRGQREKSKKQKDDEEEELRGFIKKIEELKKQIEEEELKEEQEKKRKIEKQIIEEAKFQVPLHPKRKKENLKNKRTS